MRFKDISRLFGENLYFLRQPTTLRPKNFLIKDFFKKSRLFSSAWPQRSAQNFIFIPEAYIIGFLKVRKFLGFRYFPKDIFPGGNFLNVQFSKFGLGLLRHRKLQWVWGGRQARSEVLA